MNSRLSIPIALPVIVAAVRLEAATLDGSQSLDSYPAIQLESGTQNVRTNGLGAYDFGDRNGDGTRDDAVTPSGLNLTNRTLSTSNSSNIWLNVNGGDLTATSGGMSTVSASGQKWGDIVIHNVGTVAMKNGALRIQNTGSTWETRAHIIIGQDGVSGPRAGNIQVNGLFANVAGGANQSAGGAVTIRGSGDVRIQNQAGVATNITTYTTYSYVTAGPVSIAHDGTFVARDVLATAIG